MGVAVSNDGAKLAAAGNWQPQQFTVAGIVYTSANGGATWLQRPGAGGFMIRALAASADGARLAACSARLMASADGGASWFERPVPAGFSGCASLAGSADGVTLLAAAEPAPGQPSSLFVSTIAGAAWDPCPGAPAAAWRALAVSGDGTRMLAAAGDEVWRSADRGASWAKTGLTTGGLGPAALAASHDGARLVAVPWQGRPWLSTDGGGSWAQAAGSPTASWVAVASSADGMRLVAAGGAQSPAEATLWTSADGGQTWQERFAAGMRPWTCVASSADGSRLAAGGQDTTVYVSADGGATWRPESQFQR